MPACGAPLKMPKNTGIDFSPPPAFAEIIPKIAALCDEWRNQQKSPLRRDFFTPPVNCPTSANYNLRTAFADYQTVFCRPCSTE